jgi:hypothetical protein
MGVKVLLMLSLICHLAYAYGGLLGTTEDVVVTNNELIENLAQEALKSLEMTSNNYFARKISKVIDFSSIIANCTMFLILFL